MELIQGDCLEKMRDMSNNSIDFLFCDLPYGQTSCKWDSLIDLELFWKEINRICKKECPMFFTCSTKFGVSLINSNPKNFRYDLVWVKSASCGFLNAKKMPMKKHEMIYVFYRKLPLYDLSSHKHKVLPERKTIDYKNDSFIYGKIDRPDYMRKNGESAYDPPLPNTILDVNYKVIEGKSLYGNEKEKKRFLDENGKIILNDTRYDPPLPNSIIKEDVYQKNKLNDDLRKGFRDKQYEPPLPNSILEVKSEKGKHATQKPVELIKYLLKYYSKENDVVLDPTMGSGTTGVACKEMNRKFIGIEQDDKIYKVAVERIK
tara:strand:- start:524 stop:1474 length:951 start_codon:yes stop_codon:yes gene_type:complete